MEDEWFLYWLTSKKPVQHIKLSGYLVTLIAELSPSLYWDKACIRHRHVDPEFPLVLLL